MNALANRKLKRLLDIRRHQEAARRQEYGLALRHEQEASDRRELGASVLRRAQCRQRERIGAGRLDISELRRLNEQISFGELQLDQLSERLSQTRELRIRARGELQQARRRSKSLERLEERRSEAEALEQRRQEQKVADEVALRRFTESLGRRRATRGSDSKENADE